MLIATVGFTSCKKENTIVKNTSKQYTLRDFVDSRVIENNASRGNSISPKSNLKAIIRRVPNTKNDFRLILKIDSIEVETKDVKTGLPQFSMVSIESFEGLTLNAGLSTVDPLNPAKETVFFTKENMQFTKQNDNGFFVYASAPFAGPQALQTQYCKALIMS